MASPAAPPEVVGAARPLRASGGYGTVDTAAASEWLAKTAKWLETSDDTDPVLCMGWCCACEDELKPRRVKAPLVLGWLMVQAAGLFFQLGMLQETWDHLSAFEDTLRENCGPQHLEGGVCLGPMWNLTVSKVVSFPAAASEDQPEFDFVIPADRSFAFDTRSQPTTFLVGVEPVEPHSMASWKMDIGEGGALGTSAFHLHSHGRRYAVQTEKRQRTPPSHWTGSLTLSSKYTETADVHIYVVDSMIQHLEDIHNQPQCDFASSWENFSERHNGQHHRVLTSAWHATAFFMFVSLVCAWVVSRRFLLVAETGKLLRRLVVVKFLIQDIPQQFCIMAYLYGWYSNNGLRCQMCLFHPAHCDDEHPLHWSNSMLLLFTAMSACSNQLLLHIRGKKYDEDEDLFVCSLRFSLFSISTLPLSTALLILSPSFFHFHSVSLYFLFGLPCMVGWSMLVCLPVAVTCDDDL